MKLLAIKTHKGFYITDNINNNYRSQPSLNAYKFDGIIPELSFHQDWVFVKSKPKVITKEVYQPPINKRFELRDPVSFPNLKKVYKREEVLIEEADYHRDTSDTFIDEFSETRSLYEYKEDKQPPKDEPVEFEWNQIVELKEIPDKVGFKYEVYKTQWDSDGVTNLTDKDVKYKMIDEIVTPSMLIHTKPPELSVKDSFDIIRRHVKENINGKYAEITSDYNFHFCVEKKILLIEPEEYEVDVNAFRKRRKPKYEKRLRKTRGHVVLDINNGNWKYGKTIKKFAGDNLEDMKKRIDEFLKNLLEVINEPLQDCPKCKGYGVISMKPPGR